MKKVILSSLLIVLIPTLLFVPVYALMAHAVLTDAKDYSSDVIGVWQAFQYYSGSERFVCDENDYTTLTVTEDTLTVDSTILPAAKELSYRWTGGTCLCYDTQEGTTTLFVDFDAQNNLRLTVGDGSSILLLRRGA